MEIKIIYLPRAQADLLYWKKSGNKGIQQRISKIIQSILETPYEGIGKPEALKYDYAGWWSRRINEEHRLVYQVEEWKIVIAQMRFHY
ncbi:Txe/YoeB family addiction module toxin [Mucilaginibacter gotjawali]|uniref:Putative mRNA interferase YoeB n=1 Tax=Mucilaginibacter gotjawali TaxID=1550579 RepID=A0A839SJF4_9SPHI|nr:Txe/YoeB family addiction module toxin [Mucilaginibacter gotjawali]MBB3057404.1 toxin YoeB [Mucilaginibacter gotjawali]